MSYDRSLAQRIRDELSQLSDVQEKKMFGGVSFLVQGNLACGVLGEELIVRVGPGRHVEALGQPHTRPFDMTGRPMSGWIMVPLKGMKPKMI
jgi:TfoX/Sxy family transcriptional regulator of competence genes